MSKIVIATFKFPIRWLKGFARLFKGAYSDEIVGPDVLAHLPGTFPTEFEAQLKLLGDAGESQTAARGAVGGLTEAQANARADVILLAGSARRAAKARFRGNDAILHGEFFVGQHEPNDAEAIIDRTSKLVASCKKHAEELAGDGWSAAQTTALETALTALIGAKDGKDVASDEKEGHTAEQIEAANGLYRMCCALQTVARVVYSEKRAKTDPSAVAARARFLLEEFPPRKGTVPVLPDAPPPGNPPAGDAAPTPPPTGTQAG